MTLKAKWIDGGREPKCPPNPDHPKGIDVKTLHFNGDDRTCRIDLPYPAPRCGQYLIICDDCGLRVMITTAGRPDDPRSFTTSCKIRPN